VCRHPAPFRIGLTRGQSDFNLLGLAAQEARNRLVGNFEVLSLFEANREREKVSGVATCYAIRRRVVPNFPRAIERVVSALAVS
jgi:hypothetical protein